ncbi:hypothetical protein PA598K_04797 [Paenibacillus sp. 598K]|uniref:LapA family protein n=1 Tax=Paenibacillus sp. 598K TaxID=1117987 RepID=UPI000FF9C394|nr:lipopolysaccharide assembly protein LapA domain-containing protein [Paenibacillus sp. 598K]GBF76335.1 hypothetical protein PA598K_04797 [Paenibacillus sp. 598K]
MSKQSSMKVQWLIISALVFAVITAVFAVINVEAVQVNFLFTTIQTPLILVILISTLLGGLMVFLFSFVRQVQMQRRVKQLEKQLAALQDESSRPTTATESIDGFGREIETSATDRLGTPDEPALSSGPGSLNGDSTDRER